MRDVQVVWKCKASSSGCCYGCDVLMGNGMAKPSFAYFGEVLPLGSMKSIFVFSRLVFTNC